MRKLDEVNPLGRGSNDDEGEMLNLCVIAFLV